MPRLDIPEPPRMGSKEDLENWAISVYDWMYKVHDLLSGIGVDGSPLLDSDNIGTLTTTAVTEGDNEYYTTARDQAQFAVDHNAITGSHSSLKQQSAVADASAATATDPTVSAITAIGGSGATTAQEGEINTNFTNIDTAINALIADVAEIRTKLNAFMAAHRTSGQQAT